MKHLFKVFADIIRTEYESPADFIKWCIIAVVGVIVIGLL